MKIICLIAALAVLVAVPMSLLSAEDGAALYKSKCAACHGEKGENKPSPKATAVKDTKKTAEQIVSYLTKGEKGLTMHAIPFADVNEEQAKALASFIDTLNKK
jgi:mono/diheme cytochrome c family protein